MGLNIKVVLADGIVVYVRRNRISTVLAEMRRARLCGPEPIRAAMRLGRELWASVDGPGCVDCTIEAQDWCNADWIERGDNAYRIDRDGGYTQHFRIGPSGRWENVWRTMRIVGADCAVSAKRIG